jgi:hypothetical protein
MICPKCGAQNMDGVTFCGSCGAQMLSHIPPSTEAPQQNPTMPDYRQQLYFHQSPPLQPPYSGGMVPPKNYMTEAIIVTAISFLCCCSPISIILGIIAMVKAGNVNTEFARGNISEANSNADVAKKLTIWAAVVAVAFSIITWIVYSLFLATIFQQAGGWEEFIKSYS